MAPKVSVIIPLYNAEKYFRECMRSVLSSTLKDIEIIVVNDGSTDNGPEIAKHFAEKDERIRMFSQENSGLSAARNMGMKEARGDYLAFVDSDDWVEKGVLEAMYRVACTHKSDLVIANAQVYDDKDDFYSPFYDEPLFKRLCRKQSEYESFNAYSCPELLMLEPASWKRIYKREFLVRYDFSFPVGLIFEDVPGHFRLLFMAHNISLLDEVYINYRVNREGKITDRVDDIIFDIFPIFQDIYNFMIAIRANKHQWRSLIFLQSRMFSWLASRVKSHEEFKERYFKSLREIVSQLPEDIKMKSIVNSNKLSMVVWSRLMLILLNSPRLYYASIHSASDPVSCLYRLLCSVVRRIESRVQSAISV